MKKLKKITKFLSLVALIYIGLAFFTPFSVVLQNRANTNQINYLLSETDFDLELQRRHPEEILHFQTRGYV